MAGMQEKKLPRNQLESSSLMTQNFLEKKLSYGRKETTTNCAREFQINLLLATSYARKENQNSLAQNFLDLNLESSRFLQGRSGPTQGFTRYQLIATVSRDLTRIILCEALKDIQYAPFQLRPLPHAAPRKRTSFFRHM